MPAPPVAIVQRVLQRAVEIARAGEVEHPPVAAPTALRPVLRFRRLPSTALDVVAGVLDADDEFRVRVAAAVDEREIGRVAWLWVQRPDGWKREIDRIVTELHVHDGVLPQDDDRGDDSRAKRRIEGAERAAARATGHVARLESELERARHELSILRSERDEVASRADELQSATAELVEQRAAAVAELKRVERILVRRTEERRALEAKLSTLESAAVEPATEQPAFDVDGVVASLTRLHRTARTLVDDIDALRDRLGFETEPAAVRTAVRPRRRRPLPIPAGSTDDSVEAAMHLLSRPHAVLLVDGYNASMAAWPEAELVEQRERLERMLTDLTLRTAGLTVELVFDGADGVAPRSRGARRVPGVNMRFTSADIEADDALLELVERYPIARPVIVASSDRRVRDGARRRGANVVSAAQLLAVARL